MAKVLGLIINPIAGMGGRVGLKGTDTPGILDEARRLGAQPRSSERAMQALQSIRDELKDVRILTCGGCMGADQLASAGMGYETIYTVSEENRGENETTSGDTKAAAAALKEKTDLLVFAGGDGTARDIAEVIGQEIPILGIPAGVKMHSSVFATNPGAAGEIIKMFLQDSVDIGEAEVMDIDEDAYRRGELNVKLYGVARVPVASGFIQASKQVFQSGSQESILDEIGDFFKEITEEREDTLFFLGAGSTVGVVKKWLEIKEPTLLGIDAYFQGRQVGKDLNEQGILELMDTLGAKDSAILVSPIGAQGFVLGRGSQQFSPAVLKRVGVDNTYIAATPDKVASISSLRVDTGDRELDKEFSGFRRVITGFRIQTMLKLVS